MVPKYLSPALAVAVLACCGVAHAAAELLDAQTPWRAYLVTGPNIARQSEKLVVQDGRTTIAFDAAKMVEIAPRFSPTPADQWQTPHFDDHAWPRYRVDEIADMLGGFGVPVEGRAWPTRLCLRTSFGINDPAKARDVTLTVECIGGAVVYVNGKEVGRASLAAGELPAVPLADAYGIDAYTVDGTAPLPPLGGKTSPDPAHLPRYKARLRTVKLTVPANVLVQGRNVLAIDIVRAPASGPAGKTAWSHLGVSSITLASQSADGVLPYAAALEGVRCWSAEAIEPVTNTPAAQSLVKKSWFHALHSARGLPLKGTVAANPFDALRPVRLAVPRNGVGDAQVVLTDLAGLRDVSAKIGDLAGPGGARIPASAVQIRYAVQHERVAYCDALHDRPPADAKTLPVWLTLRVPADATPGWYTGSITLAASGKTFTVPLQLLVTGLTLPEPRRFASHIGVTQSPESLAAQYKVDPWSDAHFKLLEKSYALMAQAGNDVLNVSAILGDPSPIARNWIAGGSAPGPARTVPVIRWKKTDAGLEPDLSLFDKLLDAYARHCAPPEAMPIFLWDAACVTEIADAYEGRRIPSRESKPKTPILVHVVDAKTGAVAEQEAPDFLAPTAEAFWKPMLDAVRASVTKRGWSERCIMLGIGGDIRAGSKTADALRKWAPYARWHILSHFSGDPAPGAAGKMIATGNLEVGLKEFPGAAVMSAAQLEERFRNPLDFLELPTIRWEHQEFSPPHTFATMALLRNDVARQGLDFWSGYQRGGMKNTSWFTHVNALTVPGPDGALSTVRYQMFCQGVRDAEIRRMLIAAYSKLPDEQQKPYRSLIDEFARRVNFGMGYLGGSELQFDWPAYQARLQQAAAELAGVKSDASWEKPPP